MPTRCGGTFSASPGTALQRVCRWLCLGGRVLCYLSRGVVISTARRPARGVHPGPCRGRWFRQSLSSVCSTPIEPMDRQRPSWPAASGPGAAASRLPRGSVFAVSRRPRVAIEAAFTRYTLSAMCCLSAESVLYRARCPPAVTRIFKRAGGAAAAGSFDRAACPVWRRRLRGGRKWVERCVVRKRNTASAGPGGHSIRLILDGRWSYVVLYQPG